jgi:hypothetical protein
MKKPQPFDPSYDAYYDSTGATGSGNPTYTGNAICEKEFPNVDFDDLLPDYEPVAAHTFALEDRQVDRAYALSQRCTDPTKRWSIYQNALAIEGFTQWLAQKRPHSHLKLDRCRISEPTHPDGTTAAEHLSLNGFDICVVAVPSFPDQVVAMPKSIIDEISTHFYVTVAIYEELRQVSVQSFLRWDDLKKHQGTQLATNRDGSYALPNEWFNGELDRLLQYLDLASAQTERLPQVATAPPALRQLLVEPALEMGKWLKEQWQDLEEKAGWLLMPQWQTAGAMRGAGQTADEFVKVIQDLNHQGLAIQTDARAAYRTVQLGSQPLDLCVLTAPQTQDEWSLLLIVKPPAGQTLPTGFKLEISDGHQVLVQRQVESDAPGAIYAQVAGELDEQFDVTLSQMDGTALLLPPFAWSLAA